MFENELLEFQEVNLIAFAGSIAEAVLYAGIFLRNDQANLLDGGKFPVMGTHSGQAPTHRGFEDGGLGGAGRSEVRIYIVQQPFEVGLLNCFSFVETQKSEKSVQSCLNYFFFGNLKILNKREPHIFFSYQPIEVLIKGSERIQRIKSGFLNPSLNPGNYVLLPRKTVTYHFSRLWNLRWSFCSQDFLKAGNIDHSNLIGIHYIKYLF